MRYIITLNAGPHEVKEYWAHCKDACGDCCGECPMHYILTDPLKRGELRRRRPRRRSDRCGLMGLFGRVKRPLQCFLVLPGDGGMDPYGTSCIASTVYVFRCSFPFLCALPTTTKDTLRKLTWKPKRAPIKTTISLKWGYMGFHVSLGECNVQKNEILQR